MRVLFVALVPPYPLDSGSKIRNHHVLGALARRHFVTLATFVRSPAEETAARHLEVLGIRVVTVPLRRSPLLDAFYVLDAFRGGMPFLIRRNHSRAMSAALRETMTNERFDVMHVDQFAMAHYAALARHFGARVILDVHDIMSDLLGRIIETSGRNFLRRLALRTELARLERYERKVCASADVVMTVTDRDRNLLSRMASANSRFVTIPIGIDTNAIRQLRRPPTSQMLLTVGTLFYPPNADGIEWFISRVYPLVKRSVPRVRFVAAGRRPPRRLVSLAANDSTIGLPGYVEDVAEFAAQAAVVVVPIRVGGGMRVKILEAFAMGIPVVSTSIGCEGISVTPGRHLLVADSPEDFARHVITLLENPVLGERMVALARSLVEEVYDYLKLEPRLEAAYQLLDARQSSNVATA